MRPRQAAPQHYCSSHDYYLQDLLDIKVDAVKLIKGG